MNRPVPAGWYSSLYAAVEPARPVSTAAGPKTVAIVAALALIAAVILFHPLEG